MPRLISPALFVLSALLLISTFPYAGSRGGFVWFAPIALAPMLIAAARENSPRRRLFYGWFAGCVYWSGTCYWISSVLAQFGGMPTVLVWLAFVLFAILRSLHWAVFGWLAGYLMHSRWALLSIALLWTGLERCYGPFGFAWMVLGNAGIDMGVPMRLSPLVGVYGLSFVFAMMSCAAAFLVLRRPRLYLAPLLLLALLYLLPSLPPIEEGVETAVVVQPDIQDHSGWSSEEVDATLRRMASQALDVGPQTRQPPKMILWPEVPAPFNESDPVLREQASQLARTMKADLLLGAVGRGPDGRSRNSALQFGPDGNFVARYDKVNLVPFGEQTPPMFEWVGKVTSEAGGFQPGDHPVNFPMANFKAGTFICYESVFPHYVRQYVAQGANVLVNLSNDGYFGRAAAREQHLLIVRMRAAENRRWLLRATNDGITATIDPAGRVDHRLAPYRAVSARTRFSLRSDLTLYTRHGDWFVWTCLVAGLISAARKWADAREQPKQ